jgi:hypothetical protein
MEHPFAFKRNSSFYFRVRNNQPLDPTVDQMKQIRNLTL